MLGNFVETTMFDGHALPPRIQTPSFHVQSVQWWCKACLWSRPCDRWAGPAQMESWPRFCDFSWIHAYASMNVCIYIYTSDCVYIYIYSFIYALDISFLYTVLLKILKSLKHVRRKEQTNGEVRGTTVQTTSPFGARRFNCPWCHPGRWAHWATWLPIGSKWVSMIWRISRYVDIITIARDGLELFYITMDMFMILQN